ncbi:hypothetical protein SUGI_0851070 [Cryptomeria japonica]|nr:hypothetical protein SUGI_0851070 [Cryptomeria japonica]
MASNSSRDGDNFGESPGQVVNIVLLLSSVIFFIFLILKDAVKGLKTKAHWIPGDFLVLSALTIQLLNLIGTQGEPLTLNDKDITLNEFWMIHTSRILFCVVIAYLVPGMANPGYDDFWGKIMALALIAFLNVICELHIMDSTPQGTYLRILWPRQRGTSIRLYNVLAALIFFSLVLLLLLLGCANIAGRGIERIIAKRIPQILKGRAKKDDQHVHHHSCWERVEAAVLRAWIVARTYSLEHIIARSALASSAATIVTFQIVITIVLGVCNSPKLTISNSHDRLRFTITILQCVFILIGWSVIGWRWASAVAYNSKRSSWLRIEDFWTRHLIELRQAKENRLVQAELLDTEIEKLVANESTKLTLPRRLLHALIVLQLFTVSFSKACLRGSQILLRNKLTGKLLSLVLSKLNKGYCEKYKEIFEGLQILGETSESLWLSNRNSIGNAIGLISKGKEDGECNCQYLVDFLPTKRTGIGLGSSCLEPNKPQSEFKYLCKRNPIEGSQQAPEEQFTDMSTKSWKLTAVSLLSVIFELSPVCAEIEKEDPSTSGSFPRSVIKDCLNAYSQAWDIIDFVDKVDKETDEITSETADKYFQTLQEKVDAASNSREATSPENVPVALTALEEQSKRKTPTPGCRKALRSKIKEITEGCSSRWTGSDSTDWKAAAWGSAVYKIYNSIECNEQTNMNELLKELEKFLADIINECLQKIQHLLLVNSKKWAVKSDERSIAKALYTAGKARKIMEMRDKKVMEETSSLAIVPYGG